MERRRRERKVFFVHESFIRMLILGLGGVVRGAWVGQGLPRELMLLLVLAVN